MKNKVGQLDVLSDTEAIENILQGHTFLFEVLIRRYNPVLYRIARSYGFGHHDAEDLMQEAHVSAYSALGNFEQRSSYKTWLSKIMINKCGRKSSAGYFRNEISTDAFHDTPGKQTDKSALPSQQMLAKELLQIIECSLELIPPIYRSVFVLREVEGFSVAETADLLNITSTNVKVRLNRAKAMLQQQLEHVYASPDVYEFNLVFCDRIVKEVFKMINPQLFYDPK